MVSIVAGIVVSLSSASPASAYGPVRDRVPYLRIDIAARDVVEDPVRGLIYASKVSSGPGDTIGIATIDPASGEIVDIVRPVAPPGEMAVAADGSYLYVGIDQIASIVQYRLPDLTPVRTIPLDAGANTVYGAAAIAVMPGAPETIVVAQMLGGSPSIRSLAVYDAGVRRPKMDSPHASRYTMGFGAAPTRLYGTEGGLYYPLDYWEITPDGIVGVTKRYFGDTIAASGPIPFYNGKLYTGSGEVVEPESATVVDDWPVPKWSADILIGPAGAWNLPTGRVEAFGSDSALQFNRLDPSTGDDLGAADVVGPQLSFFLSETMLLRDGTILVNGGSSGGPVTGGQGSAILLVRPDYTAGGAGEFHALSPQRIMDTRTGLGRSGSTAPLSAGQTIEVATTGVAGVPAADRVDAVVLNVTALAGASPTYLTVWPTGASRPNVSSLNADAGQTIPNLVTVPVGADGKVSVFNAAGSTHVIFDIAGYYSSARGERGARFHPLKPDRLLDTRTGVQHFGKVGTTPIDVRVIETSGVPAGITAVVLNVTATGPTRSSYVTVYPSGRAQPYVSNLNFVAGQTIPNLVIVQVPPSGIVSFANAFGETDLIADVVGYFSFDRRDGTGRFVAALPYRWFDSRVDTEVFGGDGRLGNNEILVLRRDADWISAYAFNATVTGSDSIGYVTAYPGPGRPPNSSNVNYSRGQTIPNHVIVGAGAEVHFLNVGGPTHLIVDVFGAYT